MEELQQLGAAVNYLAKDSEKPSSYRYEPPAGIPRRSGTDPSAAPARESIEARTLVFFAPEKMHKGSTYAPVL